MDKSVNKKLIIYRFAAALIFVIIFVAFFVKPFLNSASDDRKNRDYSIVIFGDSIIGECRDETSVTGLMTKELNKLVFNAALGGTSMSYTDNDERLAYTKECMNMAGLSQAIYSGDFRVQINARIKESATDYFEDTIEELSGIDFTCVDTVFIEQGLNDYHGMVPMDNPDDLYDTHTFAGAIRSSVKNLKAVNPDMNIVLVTPTYTWYRGSEITCEEYNPGGGVLADYVEKEIETADMLGIDIIDLYSDFYSHDSWEDWEKYTNDGMHPNETGRRMIADALCSYIVQNSTENN